MLGLTEVLGGILAALAAVVVAWWAGQRKGRKETTVKIKDKLERADNETAADIRRRAADADGVHDYNDRGYRD